MTEWTKHAERSNTFTLKLICYIALNASRGFARLLLWPITLYFFVSSPSSRFSSHEYLRRVPGYNGNTWEVICHIHHFSAVILDRVYFLTDRFDRFKIDVYDEKQLDKVISQEKGAILLGSHVGSFEVLRCLALRRHKIPLKIMMYKNHNAMITRILDDGKKIPRELREKTVKKLMCEYVNSIEDTVKRYPYNWFNFYDYWGDKL
jgi:predicted LPLAT superfamily acyltransferase